jgi:hypothetical protein
MKSNLNITFTYMTEIFEETEYLVGQSAFFYGISCTRVFRSQTFSSLLEGC